LFGTFMLAPVHYACWGPTPPPSCVINGRITISDLSPNSAPAGGDAFTLMVTGSGFQSSSTVQWNGTALQTTYVDASHLTASVSGNLIATGGMPNITVSNGPEIVSNSVNFAITPPTKLMVQTTSPLPNATVGVSFSQGLTATGGATPYK